MEAVINYKTINKPVAHFHFCTIHDKRMDRGHINECELLKKDLKKKVTYYNEFILDGGFSNCNNCM